MAKSKIAERSEGFSITVVALTALGGLGIGLLLTLFVNTIAGIVVTFLVLTGSLFILPQRVFEADCPYCKHRLTGMTGQKVVQCKTCKQKSSLHEGYLYTLGDKELTS